MSISRDMIYVLAAVALAAIGGGVLRLSQNSASHLQRLVRVFGRVLVILGLALAGTVFWWHVSASPRQFLHEPEFCLAAAFLYGSALWWLRPVAAPARRGIAARLGYPALVIVLVGGGQLAAYHLQRGKSASLRAGLLSADDQVAPDFQFLDADDRPHRLSEFAGKVVLLNFWDTACGPCVREMPSLSELQRKFADRGMVLVYLSSEPPEVLARFFRGRDLAGLNGRLVSEFPVPAFYRSGTAWPISFLIGRTGLVKGAWVGAEPVEWTENKIEKEL
jgi:thiol-disulfide isomerase/thioredoxin